MTINSLKMTYRKTGAVRWTEFVILVNLVFTVSFPQNNEASMLVSLVYLCRGTDIILHALLLFCHYVIL